MILQYEHYFKLFETTEYENYQELRNADPDELGEAFIEWLENRGVINPKAAFAFGSRISSLRLPFPGLDKRICQWLELHFTPDLCNTVTEFIRAYWYGLINIDALCVRQFVSYLDKLPKNSEAYIGTLNLLADIADPANIKSLKDEEREAVRHLLLMHLDTLEHAGASTTRIAPVKSLRQGKIRSYFQIYNDIEANRWYTSRPENTLMEHCKTDESEVKKSLLLWLTEIESTRSSYDDLGRIGHFLLGQCPSIEIDKLIYGWYQEAPGPNRREMLGWILAVYWNELESRMYFPCIEILASALTECNSNCADFQGPSDAISVAARSGRRLKLSEDEQNQLRLLLKK